MMNPNSELMTHQFDSIFYSIDKSQYCNYTQINCILTPQADFKTYRDFKKPCLSTCTEMHLNLVGYVD